LICILNKNPPFLFFTGRAHQVIGIEATGYAFILTILSCKRSVAGTLLDVLLEISVIVKCTAKILYEKLLRDYFVRVSVVSANQCKSMLLLSASFAPTDSQQ